ncbi:MAG: membrane dipeptidase [Trueperaceae bacterium]|nr:membrane dipeptidase [Trueperaceae bacterium]
MTIPVFDGHNDLLTVVRWPERSGQRDVLAKGDEGHLDLPRMREGGMAGGFFSAFVPSQVAPNDFAAHTDDTGRYQLPLPPALDPAVARRHVYAMADWLHEFAATSGGSVRVVTHPDEAESCLRDDVLAAALHVEGADAIDPDLETLAALYDRGVRSLGLAWSRPNAFAHGVPLAFPSTPDLGPGLTDLGRELVAACERLGVLLDVSHLTEAGFWDVLDAIGDARGLPKVLDVLRKAGHEEPALRDLAYANWLRVWRAVAPA